MEAYFIKYIDKGLKYQEDTFQYFLSKEVTLHFIEETIYNHDLSATNDFFRDLKNTFLNPKSYLNGLLKTFASDILKHDLLVLEVDFRMVKYNREETSNVLNRTPVNSMALHDYRLVKHLEDCIESEKRFILKFSKSGMNKFPI